MQNKESQQNLELKTPIEGTFGCILQCLMQLADKSNDQVVQKESNIAKKLFYFLDTAASLPTISSLIELSDKKISPAILGTIYENYNIDGNTERTNTLMQIIKLNIMQTETVDSLDDLDYSLACLIETVVQKYSSDNTQVNNPSNMLQSQVQPPQIALDIQQSYIIQNESTMNFAQSVLLTGTQDEMQQQINQLYKMQQTGQNPENQEI